MVTEQTGWQEDEIDLLHQYSLTRKRKEVVLLDLQFSHSDVITGGTRVEIFHQQSSSVEIIFDWHRTKLAEAQRTVICASSLKTTFHVEPVERLLIRWRVI